MVKWLVCGGRLFRDYAMLERVLESLGPYPDYLIHGGATGADLGGDAWAYNRGIQPVRCNANWDHYGNRAGPIRNIKMLNLKPDLIIGFPGGRGTAHMLELGVKAGITTIKVGENGETTYLCGPQKP